MKIICGNWKMMMIIQDMEVVMLKEFYIAGCRKRVMSRIAFRIMDSKKQQNFNSEQDGEVYWQVSIC